MAFLLTLFLCLSTKANDEKPDAPKPKDNTEYTAPLLSQQTKRPPVMDEKFLAAMGALAAAKTADGITTQRLLDRGPLYHEMNPIFGRRPSSARIAGTNAAYFAGEVATAYLVKKYGRGHWWSKIWMVEPAWQTAEHVRCAVHNEHLQ